MIVACRAWEGMYQGLHGIEDFEVMEVSDDNFENEINEWGRVASEELIYSFGLEDKYLEDTDSDDITESYYYCDRGWIAHKVRDDVKEKIEVLNNEVCYLGFDLFIEEYCEKDSLDI